MAISNNPNQTAGSRRQPFRLRPIAAAAALAVVLLAALVGAAPGTAAAAPTPAAGPDASVVAAGDCPFTRTLCLFDGTGFTGERFTLITFEPGGTCVSLVDHGWGGRARSAINTHNSSAALFANDGCLGGPYQVSGSVPSFGSFAPQSAWVPSYLS